MANKIKGITVKIGGDTIDLDKALKSVNKESSSLNSELSQINRQLKFDPSSAVLLSQKQEVLKESIDAAKDKLKELEDVQQDIERQYKDGEIDDGQYRAYQREVEQTKDKIKSYESQLNSTKQTQQDFNRKIEAARATLDKNKQALTNGAKSMLKWGAAATAAAAGGLFKIAENAVEVTDNVDKMSQKIGISREAYQELDFICSQTGANVDNLKMGLKTMRSVMDTTAQGTSKTQTALERLGISATDASGNLRGSEEVMWEAFSVLQQWSNESEKARLATMLFGRAGSDLMPLLNGDSESIEKMKNQAHKLGLVLSDEAIDSGVEFKDTLDQTKRSMEAAGTKLATAFLPAISDLLKKLQDHMPEIQAYAEKLGKKIADDITWLINNGDTVIKLIKATGIEAGGIWAAVKTYKFTQTIGETVSALKILKTATEAQKVATVTATAATEAETVAQEGLNVAMSANVIGAVISGLIVLGSTIWAACEATDGLSDGATRLSESEKDLIEQTEEEADSLKSLRDARKESISEIESEYSYYRDLYNELDDITDKNGEVKDGYKDRATFITTTLQEAFGVEFKWNGKIIQNYEDMKTKLEELMKQKELYAKQEAYKEEYDNAIKSVDSYAQSYISNKNTYKRIKKEYDSYVKEIKSYQAQMEGLSENSPKYLELSKKITWASNAKYSLQQDYDDAKQSFEDSEKTYVSALATISNYEKLSEAILSGSEKEINKHLTNIKNDFISSKNGTKSTLEQQVSDYEDSYKNLKQALADGVPGVTQQMVDSSKEMLDKAKLALEHWKAENSASLKDSGLTLAQKFSSGYIVGLKVSNADIKGKINTIASTTGVVGRTSIYYKGKELGNQFILGYVEGLRLKQEQAIGPAESLVALTEKAVAAAQDSHSPAKRAMPLGSDFTQGYLVGAEDEAAKSARATGKRLVGEISSQMQSASSGSVDINANLNSKLAPYTSGSAFVAKSTSKVINNTPAININFGSVNVHSEADINRLARKVSETVVQTIELKGVSMGL